LTLPVTNRIFRSLPDSYRKLASLFGAATVYIPMAATTALAVLSLGTGQLLAAGPDGFPSRLMAGPSARAMLLRKATL
jgi:hypothetical protein